MRRICGHVNDAPEMLALSAIVLHAVAHVGNAAAASEREVSVRAVAARLREAQEARRRDGYEAERAFGENRVYGAVECVGRYIENR